MIDRYGKRISVGWAPHEILWLQAAIDESHGRAERRAAFEDIADMTKRTYAEVSYKAKALSSAMKAAAAKTAWEAGTPAEKRRATLARPTPIPPSQLNTGAAFLARRTGARA